MRGKLRFRGHQAYFPRFTAHIAHTERVVIAHALYTPTPPHFTIGKAVKMRDSKSGERRTKRADRAHCSASLMGVAAFLLPCHLEKLTNHGANIVPQNIISNPYIILLHCLVLCVY